MIALIQRVKRGKVTVEEEIYSEIGQGYVIFLGIYQGDTEKEVEKLAEKITNLRIMSDTAGKMNLSILDVKGNILVVSQFTLTADLTFGRRPSFIKAARPDLAKKLYVLFVEELKRNGVECVKTGLFGTYMHVHLINDGPVTIVI